MEKFKQYINKLAPISDEEYEDAITSFTLKELKKGDVFIKQNKVCKHIAFILKGTIRSYYLNDKSEETTSCFCSENNWTTSYRSFIMQEASQLILQAEEDTQLLVIDYDSLQKLYTKNPVWQTIGRVVAEREYLVLEQYASILNNETAKEKYLRFLKEQPNAMKTASIEEIASYLGVTRRTLSRIRKEISG